MRIDKILTAIFSILLIMIGLDKFFSFLTPCSLMADIQPQIYMALGVIQLLLGMLVWNVKWRKPVAWMILGVMVYFSIRHLVGGTYDIGGAVFMGVLAILLIWDPFGKSDN